MACGQCNWYLCETCYPQQKEREDWFWGSVSYLVGVVCEEVTDAAAEFKQVGEDLEAYVSRMSLTSACMADVSQLTSEEVDFGPTTVVVEADSIDAEPQVREKGEPCMATVRHGLRSKGILAVSEASAKAEATLPSLLAPAAPLPAALEDLVDIGQNDLLDIDIDIEPTAAATGGQRGPQPQPLAADLLL